jgi:UDP-N-acetyl-2-amino-2-deoxyglucuronate dehydrogenase
MMNNFALLGAGGFVAPRHMKAIKETGNDLVVAMDPHDAVGIMDSYFPNARFFTEFERLDRHAEMLRRQGDEKRLHYVSIASPNYLHDAHMRFSLRIGANAICEKPLVLNPWNIDALHDIEKEYGKRVNTIFQVRHHPSIIELKDRVSANLSNLKVNRGKYDIDLTYITSRGRWYLVSWKGETAKSGGVATNIGVHFFDMFQWIFGKPQDVIVHLLEPTKAAGYLELENARVRWFLSLDSEDLPAGAKESGKTTYRSISISSEEFEFSEGFTNLHTVSYREILKGNGFGLEEARPSIEVVYRIRNSSPIGLKGDYHPMLNSINKDH